MIEVFYYIGLICLASCIEEVINVKRLKRNNKFANETIEDGSDKINSIQEKEFSENIKSVGDIYKKASKKISPIRTIVGLITLFWNIAGIFITEQKLFFIVLLLITFLSPYLIRMTTKDEKQQIILSYITSIATLILVSAIAYNHFFNNIS
jgi:hypothetical protein